MSFDARTPGTSPEMWDASVRALTLGALDGIGELVVVAAHPDDETLGCGGLMAQASALGLDVRIIAVTDGSASHPRSRTFTAQELRARRTLELRDAANRLSPGATITWLGFPDGRTAEFAEAIEDRLRTELEAVDARTVVAANWPGDGHRDHRMVGGIVERVVPSNAAVWGYPIWMWHWALPEEPSIPWTRAVAVALTGEDLDRKRNATHAFTSQIEPLSSDPGDERVLEPGVMAHFERDREIFFLRSRSEGPA